MKAEETFEIECPLPTDGALLASLQTSVGNIVIELFETQAPNAVRHFVELATGSANWRHPATGEEEKKRPLYDGTTFHRVGENFLIQGGCPFSNRVDGDPARVGEGRPGLVCGHESHALSRFDKPGVVAFATENGETNGSQFFITEVALPQLDGDYTVFGTVVRGFELVPKIARMTDHPVVIEHIAVARSGR